MVFDGFLKLELLNPPHFTAPTGPGKVSDPQNPARSQPQVTPEEFRKRTPKELLSALAWLQRNSGTGESPGGDWVKYHLDD